MTEGLFDDKLTAFLDDLVKQDSFSGSVLIAREGLPVFEGAYGLAEKNFEAPNQLTTKFSIGSITKTLTALGIMLLVQQHGLQLTDPVSKYLFDCRNGKKMTIQQLLSHTAGLGDGRQALRTIKTKQESDWLTDLLLLPENLQDLPFASEPGEKYQYSNAGYCLLGLIIEAVTGQGYYSWMRQQIYQPLGMYDTDAYPLDMVVPQMAYGYTTGNMMDNAHPSAGSDSPPKRKHNFTGILPYKGEPAGGIYSTAPDLLRLGEALRKNTFLEPAYGEMMMTGRVEIWPGTTYGYGLSETILPDERIVGHNGGLLGWSASFEIYLRRGYVVIVLANYDPPSADRVAGKIRELLLEL